MTKPLILDGKWLASRYHTRIHKAVQKHTNSGLRPPGLGVVLVGDNPASRAYVAMKEKVATKRCGFKTFDIILPEQSSQEDVEKAVQSFNDHEDVDGILVQLPLPKHLDERAVIDRVLPEKDADGLHPWNQGKLLRGDGLLMPCTPLGCMKLIDVAFWNGEPEDMDDETEFPEADLSGFHAIVVGRSILVGKPLAQMLLARHASVTQVHSRTKDPESICREADIVLVAVGSEHMITGSWVKEGSIVIDVGINRTAEGSLTGDVLFDDVAPRCRAITPVPGGVGPMTVAMLMYNTLQAYERHYSLS